MPDELVDLRVRFLDEDEACTALAARLPSGLDTIASRAVADPQVRLELAQARERRAQYAVQIQQHPWWSTVDNRTKAEPVLREAARRRRQEAAGAASAPGPS